MRKTYLAIILRIMLERVFLQHVTHLGSIGSRDADALSTRPLAKYPESEPLNTNAT